MIATQLHNNFGVRQHLLTAALHLYYLRQGRTRQTGCLLLFVSLDGASLDADYFHVCRQYNAVFDLVLR